MYTYNVTISVDDSVHEAWVEWMRTEHIPEVLATGMFVDATLHEVLVEGDSGTTYAAQYRFRDPEDLQLYQQLHAPGLQAKSAAKFGQKALAFRTLLRTVATFQGPVTPPSL
ncbi:MAG: DUF4286 family protein [Bacteroidota bacterium]|jgi:hypothetical protein